jgi:hypothetical protein
MEGLIVDEQDFSDAADILGEVIAAFKKVNPTERQRLLETVATFFDISTRTDLGPFKPFSRLRLDEGASASGPATSFSEDRSASPKQFMLEKQPKTDVERVACLAYYLTHYRGVQNFKTLDISKLNTEAAQPKFANAAVSVNNATLRSYLVPASKSFKQLSGQGEQFVLALPDREKAKSVMASVRPRRKGRKISEQQTEEQQ